MSQFVTMLQEIRPHAPNKPRDTLVDGVSKLVCAAGDLLVACSEEPRDTLMDGVAQFASVLQKSNRSHACNKPRNTLLDSVAEVVILSRPRFMKPSTEVAMVGFGGPKDPMTRSRITAAQAPIKP